ncbi:MAG: hypothetical protein ACOX6P_03445 [Candidatus Merdivicinus sp.]
MRMLFTLIVWGLEWYTCGRIFLAALRYMEGHRIGNVRLRRVAVWPAGWTASLLTQFLFRGFIGFQEHPLGEWIASLFIAALLAALVSTIGLLFQSRKSSSRILKSTSRTVIPHIIVLRQKYRRAG